MLKFCSTCQTDKSSLEFRKHSKSKDGLQYECKECVRKYQKIWYQEHKQIRLQQIAKWKEKRKETIKAFVDEIKQNPCIDCGKNFDACAMDFDHLDPNTKVSEISTMIHSQQYSLDEIKSEIEKCELVCAVCHRLRTEKRRKSSNG